MRVYVLVSTFDANQPIPGGLTEANIISVPLVDNGPHDEHGREQCQ